MTSSPGILAALLIVLAAPGTIFAQTDVATGSLQGDLIDESGTPLPGVSVSAINRDTGFRRMDTSNFRGRYRIDLLPPGIYAISTEITGFRAERRSGIVVPLGVAVTRDFVLKLANVSESIVVSGEVPVIESTRSASASNVDARSIQTLPLNGRKFTDLIVLSPAAVKSGDGTRVDIGGQRGIENAFNIDGASAQSAFFGEQIGGFGPPFFFSQEAIQEFQVVASTYQAQYGNATGGIVNAVTKSGSNELHGSAFFYYRDQALSDRNANGLLPGDFESKQFGATLGGPIERDVAHFFVAYDGQRREQPSLAVPADSTADHALSNPENLQFLMEHGYNVEADSGTFKIGSDVDVPLVKLDAQLSASSNISLRDNYLNWKSPNGVGTGLLDGLSNAATDNATSNSLVASWDLVLSAAIFNELTVQGLYENRPRFPNTTALPQVAIGSDWTFGQLSFAPSGLTDRRYQVTDNVNDDVGNHALRGGFDVSRSHFIDPFLRNAGGVYSYNNWDDFFAGDAQSYQQGFSSTGGRVVYDQWLAAGYLQDEWRVTPRVTIDAGLRYEYQRQPGPQEVNPLYPRTGHVPNDSNNWAPRLGFAWDVGEDHRTVVRGGAGLFYVPTPSLLTANVLLNDGVSNANYFFNAPTSPVWPGRLDGPPTGATSSTPTLQVMAPDFQNTQIFRATLGVEREIVPGLAAGIEATYAKTRYGERGLDANLAPVGVMPDGRTLYGAYDSAGRVTPDRPDQNFGQILEYASDGIGKYAAVSLTVRKRFSGTWQMNAFYTYAFSKDDSSNERISSVNGSVTEDSYAPAADYGYSDSFVRHNIVVSSTENLPWNLTVAQTLVMHSGQPYSALAGYDANADGASGDRADTGFDPATGEPSGSHFGRNTFFNPWFKTLDLSLQRTWHLGPVDATLIAQGFNVLHSANRVVPANNQNYYVVSGGKVSGLNPNFGKATQASFLSARQFQLGARLAF